ncbi:MAG: anthranilate synthase component I [Micavibrio aeruginosavorus]|uniref:Anthranilate synthase component 1 n=1 Tax=Micavibrio aeruginosavorus TaxID=349221 RepID=A0A7T5UG01_9BACT|nr:MAG: anthranilate synthase component I [Micavibrio aeruginosavorus]
MTQPAALEGFKNNFDGGLTQLVWRWVPADLETPVSAYLKLTRYEPYALLLESVEGGSVLGRYSAIGLQPDLFWRCHNGIPEISTDSENWDRISENAIEHFKQLIEGSRLDVTGDIPPMASSGMFGYFGYDMVRLVEDIPNKNPDPIDIPQALMMRPTVMIIFDNVKQMACIATPVRITAENTSIPAEEIYQEAIARIEDTLSALRMPLPDISCESQINPPLDVSSNTTPARFQQAVEKAKEYIRAGDIFQVVPSQRFSVPFDLPSIELYRALRRLNPSPFLFHIQTAEFSLVGSSPEILVRVRNGEVTIRPIAGTRRRGGDLAEDKSLAEELLADPKERAEHLMLLDLGRNDVGRVSDIGSVKVTEQFIVEYYSHVMHIVSNVTGTLRADTHSLDALFAGFPAGTVTGAPKIRAMEIIDELEPEKRSFYGGCVGYFDGNGNVDTCITLRTGLIKNGVLYVQAGAGVVADSDALSEYQETVNKAQALIQAAEEALQNHNR